MKMSRAGALPGGALLASKGQHRRDVLTVGKWQALSLSQLISACRCAPDRIVSSGSDRTEERMSVSVGMGIAAFPFADAGGFWRWVDLCEEGGVDSIWQSDRLIGTD